MKRTWIVSLATAALLVGQSAFADHDKDCKGTHGTISAKSDNSITVNGKMYTLEPGATVTRENGSTVGVTGVKVGDKVCLDTASSDSKQVAKLMVLDRNAAVSASTKSGEVAYADKLNEVERKAHEAMCKGHHGTITDKTAQSISVDGKTYALKINTPVNKQEEPLLPKTVKVGDRVCFDLKEAADGSQQIAKLMAIDEETDKTRVRDKDTGADVKIKKDSDKIEVNTPDHKIEVK
jgi:hypothetical protein